MSQLSRVLRKVEGHRIAFWCPGCDEAHMIRVAPAASPWEWNGDSENPTFSPSVKVEGRRFTDQGQDDYDLWVALGCPKPTPEFPAADLICHSFVTAGCIQFLDDCTHALKGQTVELPAWETADA